MCHNEYIYRESWIIPPYVYVYRLTKSCEGFGRFQFFSHYNEQWTCNCFVGDDVKRRLRRPSVRPSISKAIKTMLKPRLHIGFQMLLFVPNRRLDTTSFRHHETADNRLVFRSWCSTVSISLSGAFVGTKIECMLVFGTFGLFIYLPPSIQ